MDKLILVTAAFIGLGDTAAFLPAFEATLKNGTFWQITDIHYDSFYVKGGDTTQYCHTPENQQSGKAGLFGDYNCETNKQLFISAVKAMAKIKSNPEFILWTGDSSPHWNQPSSPDWEYIYKAEKFITTTIRMYFPTVPIVPVLGNHDAFEPDNFTSKFLAEKI
jgi:hypothetical protein